jgi:single-strand DNA-binding protein
MSGSVNKTILVGNVGDDPKIRATQQGKKIASFSLATSESWKDKSGERKKKTTWHNIVVFSEGLVRVVEGYVKSGTKLYIEGQIDNRKWTDDQGKEHYRTEVVLQGYNSQLVLLSAKPTNQHSVDKGNAYQTDSYEIDDNDPGF